MNADVRVDEWFRQFRQPIRNWLSRKYCSRIGRSPEADDLAQEVFERLSRYEIAEVVKNPSNYLYTIAANVANEWSKRSRVRRPHEDGWLEGLECETNLDPEISLSQQQLSAVVQTALRNLPQRRRNFVYEHAILNKTYKEIAKENGTTYRVVLRELSRGYAALRADESMRGLINGC